MYIWYIFLDVVFWRAVYWRWGAFHILPLFYLVLSVVKPERQENHEDDNQNAPEGKEQGRAEKRADNAAKTQEGKGQAEGAAAGSQLNGLVAFILLSNFEGFELIGGLKGAGIPQDSEDTDRLNACEQTNAF